jgi:regulator of cell morphogenesis and NO signaling
MKAKNMMVRIVPEIHEEAYAGSVVRKYYRTAAIFNRYGIEYCCGAKWPLKMVCELKELDIGVVLSDLMQATRIIEVHHALPFESWKIDFLTDYIVNIHHQYLKQSLPTLKEALEKFVVEHAGKYPEFTRLQGAFNELYQTMPGHLQHEEEIIFPYIRQIAHAYESKESYAGLLVRTLRKPIEALMFHEHDHIEKLLEDFRELTQGYVIPSNACTSHFLVFSLLKELDDELVQHIYLENNVLFPKAVAMEKELLERPR